METKQGKKESPRTGGWISALKFLPLVVFAALVIVFKLELLLAAANCHICGDFGVHFYLSREFRRRL